MDHDDDVASCAAVPDLVLGRVGHVKVGGRNENIIASESRGIETESIDAVIDLLVDKERALNAHPAVAVPVDVLEPAERHDARHERQQDGRRERALRQGEQGRRRRLGGGGGRQRNPGLVG